jgi:hypothetical protein
MKATEQGQEQMRWNALKSTEQQTAIYGGLFINRSGIKRVNEARHQARVNGGKASGAARRVKKSGTNSVIDETATMPVIYVVNQQEVVQGGAVYRG